MLSLSWRQAGYQTNQTPPAGALIFELRQTDAGARNVHTYYAAQSLDDMRHARHFGASAPVPIPGCPNGSCTLDEFAKPVEQALDQDCTR